jgi:DNA polymerase V
LQISPNRRYFCKPKITWAICDDARQASFSPSHRGQFLLQKLMATKFSARQAIERSRKGIGGRPRGAPTAVIRLPLPVAAVARRLSQGTLRAGDINGFLDVQPGARATVPFAGADAKCGFPSPAEDYLDNPLDFNELLVSNPAATFAVHLSGDSMIGAGLFPGDIAVVDRSVAPTNNCIVLALLDGEFTVKRYRRRGSIITLLPENPAFSPIDITEDRAFEIWGVITRSIRML